MQAVRETASIFRRNIKWRFQHPVTIIMTLLQPMIWLLLYSSVASGMMQGDYLTFILAGILLLVVFASAGSSGISNYISRLEGSFYRIYISPVKRSSIVLGHILEASVLAFIEVIALILISLIMSAEIRTGITGFFLIIVLLLITVFFVAPFSFLLSLLLPDENVFHTVMNTFVLPVFFLSTALVPYDKIPGNLQTFVLLNPFTHVIGSLRGLIMNDQADAGQYLTAVILMLIPALLFFFLAVKRLQQEIN